MAGAGDIILLNFRKDEEIQAGDVVVFKIEGRDVPIVHRAISTHTRDDGEQELLTKGDHNVGDDKALYARGQRWLNRRHLLGKAIAYAPKAGMATILMNDYPSLKYALVSIMGVFVLTGNDA